MKKFYLILVFLASISLVSFSQNDYIAAEVSSFGNYDMSGKTFYVLSGNSNITNKDLEFIQYRDIIIQCMIRKNAIPTNNHDTADVCILMDYGITDKSYVATYGAPTWGISGIVLNSISTTIGLGYTIATQTVSSTYGMTGLAIRSKKVPEYRSVLNLYAYDNQDRTNEPVMLWKINISSDNSTSDLEVIFPYLAEAEINYIGTTSNGKKRSVVQEKNKDVYLMKNGYYQKENAKYFQPTHEEKTNKPMPLHSMLVEDDCTYVNFLAEYVFNKFTNPKFIKSTYILYHGKKYPIVAVYLPCETGLLNYLGNKIYLQPQETLIQFVFPVKINKGDTFDIVSYSNKKETKKFIEYENIVF